MNFAGVSQCYGLSGGPQLNNNNNNNNNNHSNSYEEEQILFGDGACQVIGTPK